MDDFNAQLEAFEVYHLLRETGSGQQRQAPGAVALPALGHALAGSISTALSLLLTYPLNLVITRLQTRQRHQNATRVKNGEYGLVQVAKEVYRQGGGWRALYSGVEYDVVKSMADAFLFFLAYTFLRQKRLKRGGKKGLPVHDELLIGMMAGALARAFTTPLQIIVTRKQTVDMKTTTKSSSSVSSSSPSSSSSSTSSTKGEKGSEKPEQQQEGPSSAKAIIKHIYRHKGLRGFWSGYSATLILTLNPSLTFFFHRLFSRALLTSSSFSSAITRRTRVSAAALTFLLAATSKAFASTITYPFSLAKARMQADGFAERREGGDAREKTALQAVLRLARRDGIGALYAGLEAEVLKGFLSHGITMALKERVHAMVVQVYILLYRDLKKRINTNVFLDEKV